MMSSVLSTFRPWLDGRILRLLHLRVHLVGALEGIGRREWEFRGGVLKFSGLVYGHGSFSGMGKVSLRPQLPPL